jgi:hypothetical protein
MVYVSLLYLLSDTVPIHPVPNLPLQASKSPLVYLSEPDENNEDSLDASNALGFELIFPGKASSLAHFQR